RRSFDSIPWLATILLSRLLARRFCQANLELCFCACSSQTDSTDCSIGVRSDRRAAIDPSTATKLGAARGAMTPYRNNIAPVAAPANIVTIDASLLFHRGLIPPDREESDAKPVTVSVSTVVVTSGTASFLTTALRNPIATAV